MSAEDIEYMDNYKEFPTKESALDWLDNYLSLNERNNLIRALEQEPCEDAISRRAVLDKKELVELEDGQSFYCISPEDVEALPPVTLQPKTGHWIIVEELHGEWEGVKKYACDKCGDKVGVFKSNYCPNCGAKMVDPQKSEDKE